MTPEETRLSEPQGGDQAVPAARADREARLAADEASLLAGKAPGHDEQLRPQPGAHRAA